MFDIYLEDGHYGSREVVKICSGCFVLKIKPVIRMKMALSLTKKEDYWKLENVHTKSNRTEAGHSKLESQKGCTPKCNSEVKDIFILYLDLNDCNLS